MCAGTIAYVLYQGSRYIDDGTTGSMSKVGRKSGSAPRVSSSREAGAGPAEEIEMNANLLTQEEILSQIEKVSEKEMRNCGLGSSDSDNNRANEDEDSSEDEGTASTSLSRPTNPLM